MNLYLEGTLTAFVATRDRIYLLSDGRVTNSKTGESSDEHSKVHPINKYVGILVAGRFVPILASNVREKSSTQAKNSVFEIAQFTKEEFETAWRLMNDQFTSEEIASIRLFSFIAGFENGQPKLFYVDNMTNPPFEIKERLLFQGTSDFEIAALSHGSGDYNNPSGLLTNQIKTNAQLYSGVMSLDDIIRQSFDNVKKAISEHSPQIGGKTFMGIIDANEGFLN